MVKAEWGQKRTCLSCEIKFYDMMSNPIICPGCGAPFDPNAAMKLKRARQAGVEKPAVEQTRTTESDTDKDIDETLDDDADEAVLEDTSDLDSDDDMRDVTPAKTDESDD